MWKVVSLHRYYLSKSCEEKEVVTWAAVHMTLGTFAHTRNICFTHRLTTLTIRLKSSNMKMSMLVQ